MNINTRLTYDESVLNHADALEIIRKQEKIAVRHGLYNDVTVRIDSENTIFYDIRLYVKTCKRNSNTDTFGMYLYFQFVPSDKYFAMSLMSLGKNLDVAEYSDMPFYDTSLCAVLNLVNQIIPTWESINEYFNTLRMVALREYRYTNPQ